MFHDTYLEAMAEAYIEAALFTEAPAGRITKKIRKQALIQCMKFFNLAGILLSDVRPEAAGHNLWLSRNGHGTGFQDLTETCGDMGRYRSGPPHPYATALHAAASAMGEATLESYRGWLRFL